MVADGSPWEMGTLGQLGAVPGLAGRGARSRRSRWSRQIRAVLERYREAGGRVEMEMFEGSGHFPAIDARERCAEVFFGFVAAAET